MVENENVPSKLREVEDIRRGFRHAVREYLPVLRPVLSVAFAGAAAFSDQPAHRVAFAAAAVGTAFSAVKSLVNDRAFWVPPVRRWLDLHL